MSLRPARNDCIVRAPCFALARARASMRESVFEQTGAPGWADLRRMRIEGARWARLGLCIAQQS
eukprot:13486796-Alexandrium_andersonii.AAC.1